MEIEALGKKWTINGIGYAPSRKLRVKTLQSLRKAYVTDSEDVDIDKIDYDQYYDAIEMALSIAFNDVEKSVEGLTHDEIDTLGITILNKYTTIEKKANGGVV
mgnify:FL=1